MAGAAGAGRSGQGRAAALVRILRRRGAGHRRRRRARGRGGAFRRSAARTQARPRRGPLRLARAGGAAAGLRPRGAFRLGGRPEDRSFDVHGVVARSLGRGAGAAARRVRPAAARAAARDRGEPAAAGPGPRRSRPLCAARHAGARAAAVGRAARRTDRLRGPCRFQRPRRRGAGRAAGGKRAFRQRRFQRGRGNAEAAIAGGRARPAAGVPGTARLRPAGRRRDLAAQGRRGRAPARFAGLRQSARDRAGHRHLPQRRDRTRGHRPFRPVERRRSHPGLPLPAALDRQRDPWTGCAWASRRAGQPRRR